MPFFQGHVMRYLFLCFVMFSYPTYVMYKVSKRPKQAQTFNKEDVNPEVQAELDRRAELRKQGKQPVLNPEWLEKIKEFQQEAEANKQGSA